MHSDIDAIERTKILHDLRAGQFDVLVGINLLREGLDLPEVSLVGIFDADKEGFLRSTRSLIQTCGRAARNANGQVVMYADVVTGSMQQAIDIMEQRRVRQLAHNAEHGIVPRTVIREIAPSLGSVELEDESIAAESESEYQTREQLETELVEFENSMRKAAEQLEFEFAAKLRDRITELRKQLEGDEAA